MAAAYGGWPPGERRLVWIEGEAGACRRNAQARLRDLPPDGVVWLGDDVPENTPALAPGHGSRRLGGDLAAAVLDAHSGFDPDDLGALGGALRGDGALLLLTPPGQHWPSRTDPAITRLASHGCPPAHFHGHFLTRMIRLLAAHPAVRREPTAGQPPVLRPPSWQPEPSATDAECLTDDQSAAVAAILAAARTQPPAPLLLTADRGRGKSAALGIAARRLLDAGIPVAVTAPSFHAAAAVFRHAAPRAPAFVPPEATGTGEGLLLVDEAAALTLPRLRSLVASQPRAVLATTVHGYEGTGRGVSLRLADELLARYPGSRRHHLNTPVRWRAGDPLEDLVTQALLLDAEPAELPAEAPGQHRIESLDGAGLAADEARLRTAFGLLVAGHYQTRPRDLRQLLDDPEIRLWLAVEGDQVTGVLAARTEGGFDPGLAREIWLGRRRPAGHLMAQSLACHAGVRDAPTRRGLRILRVAVHPLRRRHGVGRALVAAAERYATRGMLDWLGASFGATSELLAFWQQIGLTPVRVGNRRDAASGSHAVMVMRPLTASGEALCREARQRLARHFPSQRRHALAAMPASLADALARDLPAPDAEEIDALDLYAFAHGRRSLLDTHAALARRAEQERWLDWADRDDAALLRAALAQPHDLPGIARRAGLRGRREALRRLRDLVAARLARRVGVNR